MIYPGLYDFSTIRTFTRDAMFLPEVTFKLPFYFSKAIRLTSSSVAKQVGNNDSTRAEKVRIQPSPLFATHRQDVLATYSMGSHVTPISYPRVYHPI